MTLELKKLKILDKITSLNIEITEIKSNIVVAYKLSFTASAHTLEERLSLLIDFRNWLEELEVRNEPR
jgi:hypothetical protein